MMMQLFQNLWEKGKSASLLLSRADTREFLLYCLILLFLPTQFGKHFWPEYSLVSGFRVDYLSPTLYVTDILIGLLFLQVLLKKGSFPLRWRLGELLPYLLLMLFLLITIIPSGVPSAGFYSLLKVAEYLFFGWYTAAHLGRPLYKCAASWIFAVTVSGEGLLALLQVVYKGSLGGPLYFLGERAVTSLTPGAATAVLGGEVFLRPYGTFSHPNVLAGFLLIGLVYLLFNRRAFAFRFGEFALVLSFLLGTLGILVALSRIPLVLWFGFLAVHGTLLLFRKRAKRKIAFSGQIIFPSLLVFGLVFFLFSSQLLNRFTQTNIGEESVVVRLDLTKIALSLTSQHPILGVGLGNFLFHSAEQKPAATPLFFAVQPVHNIFLFVLAETGVLGLLLFLWFLLRSYRHGSVAARTLLSLVVILGLFDHYFLTLQQGQLLFAFILGLCWSERKSKNKKSNSKHTE